MAAELVQHSDAAPCVLFDEVPGTPRAFASSPTFRRQAQEHDARLPAGVHEARAVAGLPRQLPARAEDRPLRLRRRRPDLRERAHGDEVDVTKFPVPVWHEGDGGRYIGTGSYNVTIDPEERWVNVGTYRVMIHDRNTLGFYMSPGKHGRIHRDKYRARNEPMPVCIVAGGVARFPHGLQRDALRRVRIRHRRRAAQQADEGGAGDSPGCRFRPTPRSCWRASSSPASASSKGRSANGPATTAGHLEEPVLDVKAIYHRNNPILLGCPPCVRRRAGALPGRDSLGAHPPVRPGGRRARRQGGLGPRSGGSRLPWACRSSSATPGTQAGRARRLAVPARIRAST